MKKIIIFLSSFLFAFEIYSPAFKQNSYIPEKYTCEGAGISIPLILKKIPENTHSIAVIMQDPDAPGGIFTHWLLYNINPHTKIIPQNLSKTSITAVGVQGINSFGKVGYSGPCPPEGQTHRYIITAVALNKKIKLNPDLSLKELLNKIRPYVFATAQYVGLYGRKN